MAIALLALESLGVFVVLVVVLSLLQRRSAVLRQLRWPSFVSAVAAGALTFAWFGGDLMADGGRKAWIAAAMLFALASLHFLVVYLFDAHLRARRGLRLPPLIPRVVVGTVYVIGALIAMTLLVEGFDLGPVLATSAVTSLVLGLALQPILGNFFSGLVISFERPFRINDWIQFGTIEGRVVDITWRTTHLRTRDNDNLIVPNSQIASQELVNFYYPHPLHMERVNVRLHYRTPPYRATDALLEAARSVEGVLDKPSPEVYLLEFEDFAILYELRVWMQDIAERPRLESELRRRIWEVFRRRELVIPFPIRTLEIEPRANLLRMAEVAPPEAAEEHDAWLFVAEGAERGTSIRIGSQPITVGRAMACNLNISDPKASKMHFRVERGASGFVVLDLGSSTGTLVNGRPVQRHLLQTFERIRAGDTVLVFENDGD
jgi:small-conductance mechanosensitive channel